MEKRDTLERLIPEQVHEEDSAATESLDLHLERYEFAATEAGSGPLLDIACGVGYGTRLLAERRPDLRDLTGVDISPQAIRYAREHYSNGSGGSCASGASDSTGVANASSDADGTIGEVRFVEQDAMTFGGEGPGGMTFGTIVSLETIEHLPDPDAFFARLAGLLGPGGVLVASVPVTVSVDLNPHHLHDFTERTFRRMGKRNGLVEIASHRQIQSARIRDLWGSERRFRRENLRPNLAAYYASHPGAFLKRVATTLRRGLANHYLTIAWKKGG